MIHITGQLYIQIQKVFIVKIHNNIKIHLFQFQFQKGFIVKYTNTEYSFLRSDIKYLCSLLNL
jgi:hypothetical protein